MPPTCTICRHENRRDIEKALISGVPLRDLAGRYGLSKSSLQRHKAEHLPVRLLRAKEAAEVSQASDLLGEIRRLQDKALDILAQAEAAGDLRTALMGVREARSCLELAARVSGQVRDQLNVSQHLVIIQAPGALPETVFPGVLDQ